MEQQSSSQGKATPKLQNPSLMSDFLAQQQRQVVLQYSSLSSYSDGKDGENDYTFEPSIGKLQRNEIQQQIFVEKFNSATGNSYLNIQDLLQKEKTLSKVKQKMSQQPIIFDQIDWEDSVKSVKDNYLQFKGRKPAHPYASQLISYLIDKGIQFKHITQENFEKIQQHHNMENIDTLKFKQMFQNKVDNNNRQQANQNDKDNQAKRRESKLDDKFKHFGQQQMSKITDSEWQQLRKKVSCVMRRVLVGENTSIKKMFNQFMQLQPENPQEKRIKYLDTNQITNDLLYQNYCHAFFMKCNGLFAEDDDSLQQVPPIVRIKCWLNSREHEEDVFQYKTEVATEIQMALDQANLKEIAGLEKGDYGQSILGYLQNNGCFNGTNTFKSNLMILYATQGILIQTTKVLLFCLKRVNGLQLDYNWKETNFDEFEQNLEESLKVYYQITQTNAKNIMRQPQIYFNQELLDRISKSKNKESILSILGNMPFCDEANASETVELLDEANDKYAFMSKQLEIHQHTLRLERQQIAEVVEKALSYETVDQIFAFISKGDYFNQMQAERQNNLARQNLNTEELKAEEDQIIKAVSQWSEEQKEIFKQVANISDGLGKREDYNYEHRVAQVYEAALILIRQKKCIYSQQNPGFGKTHVNILVALHLESKNIEVIYVVINELLKVQLAEKINDLGMKMVIVVADELIIEQKKTITYIFDEYYDYIIQQKLDLTPSGRLQAFWTLGIHRKANLIISTGTYSSNFEKYLKLFFNNQVETISYKKRTGQAEKVDIKVICFPELDSVFSRMKSDILKITQTAPVIVINLPNADQVQLNKELEVPYWKCNSPDELIEQQKAVSLTTKGVVYLRSEQAIGIDFKFKMDAKVLVFSKHVITRELFIQYLARGQRARGAYGGNLYMQKNRIDAQFVAQKLKIPQNVDFKDGAYVLQCLDFIFSKKSLLVDREIIIGPFKHNTWMTTVNDFCQKIPKSIRPLINEYNNNNVM